MNTVLDVSSEVTVTDENFLSVNFGCGIDTHLNLVIYVLPKSKLKKNQFKSRPNNEKKPKIQKENI